MTSWRTLKRKGRKRRVPIREVVGVRAVRKGRTVYPIKKWIVTGRNSLEGRITARIDATSRSDAIKQAKSLYPDIVVSNVRRKRLGR